MYKQYLVMLYRVHPGHRCRIFMPPDNFFSKTMKIGNADAIGNFMLRQSCIYSVIHVSDTC